MNARRPRLSDQVTAELERRILAGELEPGGLLPAEPELGAELEVSRSVIRDAIRTLAARGLVEVRQGSGTRSRSSAKDRGAGCTSASTILTLTSVCPRSTCRDRAIGTPPKSPLRFSGRPVLSSGCRFLGMMPS